MLGWVADGPAEQSLTAWVLIDLQHGRGGLHAVDDAQQSACEPQQLAEAVEAKVDEVVRQADHLWRGGGAEVSVGRAKAWWVGPREGVVLWGWGQPREYNEGQIPLERL